VIPTLESSGKGKAKVPGPEGAVVELAKLRDCLLSDTHSAGRNKVRVVGAQGSGPDDPEACGSELLRIVRDGELEQREDTPFGTMLLEWGRRLAHSVRCWSARCGSFAQVSTAVATRATANGSR
jgi:hypothetical protein